MLFVVYMTNNLLFFLFFLLLLPKSNLSIKVKVVHTYNRDFFCESLLQTVAVQVISMPGFSFNIDYLNLLLSKLLANPCSPKSIGKWQKKIPQFQLPRFGKRKCNLKNQIDIIATCKRKTKESKKKKKKILLGQTRELNKPSLRSISFDVKSCIKKNTIIIWLDT